MGASLEWPQAQRAACVQVESVMNQPLIVPGRYADRMFVPDGPLPDAEGSAHLVITPTPAPTLRSVAEAFGTAPVLRAGDDILAQLRADRDEWGDR